MGARRAPGGGVARRGRGWRACSQGWDDARSTRKGTALTPALDPRPIILGENVCYAFEQAGGGVLLVDAGPDFDDPERGPTWDLALEQARAHGFAPRDVATVLVTHGHIDHAGLAHRWAAEGARVLAGEADVPALARGYASHLAQREARRGVLARHGCPPEIAERLTSMRGSRRLRWEPCPPDALASAEAVGTIALAGDATLEVVPAPGHTPGNLVAWLPSSGDLCSGDTLLPTTVPTPGIHFPALAAGDEDGGDGMLEAARWPSLPSFLRSVGTLRALPVRRILPGHGEVVDEPSTLFDRFGAHHERRARRIRAALEDAAALTAYEVVRALFPRLPDLRIGQAMTETLGHLDVLVERGEAAWVPGEDGLLRCRLVEA